MRKIDIETFYSNGVDIIRDIILGVKGDKGKDRAGLQFDENMMRVADVEILDIQITDNNIRQMLENAQFEAVSGNIKINRAEKNLEITKREEEVRQEEFVAQAATAELMTELEVDKVAQRLTLTLAKIKAEVDGSVEKQKAAEADEEVRKFMNDSELARHKASEEQRLKFDTAEQKIRLDELKAEAESVVARFEAAQGGFSEALLALSNQETLQKVAEAMSVQNLIGGRNVVDVVQNLFDGSPLENVLKSVAEKATHIHLDAGEIVASGSVKEDAALTE